MKSLHVMTVGISLITNFCKARNCDAAAALKRGQQVAAFLAENPRANSAEINSLDARTGFLRKSVADLSVSLVYTETKEGKLAAKTVGNFLKKKGINVIDLKLNYLDLPGGEWVEKSRVSKQQAQRLAERGLGNLRDKVDEHVKKLRKQCPELQVEFNVTGGYKAEVAVLYKLGCDLGVPVYYLHETYKTAITLP